MPYHLKRKGDDYFVVDDSGKKYSSHGLDKATARKQMTALNIAHARKEGYNIPPRDPSPTGQCKRRGTLKGNIGELHPELKAMFADKAENAFIEKLYSKFKALDKAPKMEVVSKEIAEVKPKKKEFEVESREVMEVKPSELRQIKSKIKEIEEAAEDPRRLRRKIKLIRPVEEVESRQVEPPTPIRRKIRIVKPMAEPVHEAERVAARSIGEEIVAGVRPFNTLKQKERQDVYQQFLKEGITGDDVPKEYRKGYKTWIGKEKRKGRL